MPAIADDRFECRRYASTSSWYHNSTNGAIYAVTGQYIGRRSPLHLRNCHYCCSDIWHEVFFKPCA